MKDFLLCVHSVIKTLNLEIQVLVWQIMSKKSFKVGPGMEEKYCYMFPTRLKINTKCVSVVDGMKENICCMLTTRLTINTTTIEI